MGRRSLVQFFGVLGRQADAQWNESNRDRENEGDSKKRLQVCCVVAYPGRQRFVWEHIYKILEDIRTGEYDGEQMVVPAAMGLFLQTADDFFVLAIQQGPEGIDPLCC